MLKNNIPVCYNKGVRYLQLHECGQRVPHSINVSEQYTQTWNGAAFKNHKSPLSVMPLSDRATEDNCL